VCEKLLMEKNYGKILCSGDLHLDCGLRIPLRRHDYGELADLVWFTLAGN
jgi:hypothetical protein